MSDNLNKYDVEEAQKLFRRLMKSQAGQAVIQEGLGVRFADLSEATKPKVAILVPSHKQPTPETTEAFGRMIAASRDKATVLPRPSISSSVVHWVRNQLLSSLYKDGLPFTHVLFMDDDIVPPEDALVKLLSHDVDIVAGACTVRQDPPLPNFRLFDEKEMAFRTAFEWNGEGLIKVGGVGTGFMLISKKALEAVAQYHLDCTFEKKYLGMGEERAAELSLSRKKRAEEKQDYWWFEFLKHPYGDGEYGEDISFCFKARECGFDVYVDTTIRPRHMGSYGYSLDDYIPYQQSVIAAQEKRDGIVVVD